MKNKHLLIVDDEASTRESLRMVFEKDYAVSLATSAAEARQIVARSNIDLVLLDIIMPDVDGITFLHELHTEYPDLPVVMISAASSVKRVVEAMKEGAWDYVTKPFDVAELRHIVSRALENSRLRRKLHELQCEVAEEFPVDRIVGNAPLFAQALQVVRKAASTDSTILIIGESGTGKELIARLVHRLSPRRDEPFVPVHCGAIPEQLMESELFGYEKGAFTGADRRKPGRFDMAGSGTIFFDEISETPHSAQVKLLRVLQEREFVRVGGSEVVRTDARIVAATAQNLEKLVEQGRFRRDLFYRLSVVPVRLPPLRNRREDIPLLAQYFLNYFGRKVGSRLSSIDRDAMRLLLRYDWPGNIRELRNLIERMAVLHRDQDMLQPEFLPEEFHVQNLFAPLHAGTFTLEEAVNDFERHLVIDALKKAGGVQTRAAELLGTTRRILKYRIEKLNIQPQDFRPTVSSPQKERP
ncbi:MAG TPA: sigma-54-dependent Fis family transcriptional regulator [Kiritimatiellae bacterium]|nr:sigma-54-dependent Fis family transcriptional regulator [Kiritimatiellia bacterium]